MKSDTENTEISWANLDDEKATFIFEQAKEYLEKTLYASDQLDNKAFILLGFSVTFLTGTIGYILTKGGSIGWLIWPLLVYASSLLVVCHLLKKVIRPTGHHGTGNLPNVLLNNDILKQQIEYIIVGEAQNYANRCKENNITNADKGKRINQVLSILFFSPMFILIFCLVFAYCL